MNKRNTKNSPPAGGVNEAGVSRRGFMKSAALGAGATAGVFGGGAAFASTPDDWRAKITRPPQFDEWYKAPVAEFSFPANGARVFARACKEEGLGALFCCPGNYQIITEIATAGIPTYGGRLEGSMTSAADAFIRVSGEIAAASGTEGPGFTNMICAIAAANACRTPLLVVASNMSMRGDDTEGGIQRGYQQPTTEGIKKYGKRLIDGKRVHEYAGYAFRQLRSGVPGPVHLDFVSEVTGANFENETDLDYFVEKDRYRTEARPHPDPKQIAKAVELIKQAQRPMIVASTGVFYSKAWDALRLFAEKAQIPVTETGPMRGKFSDDHELCASAVLEKFYEGVDLVIYVGQYCIGPSMGARGSGFGPDAKVIRIDPKAEEIGRNVPVDVGIVSCEKAALEALYEATPPMKRDSWIAELKKARADYEARNEEWYQLGVKYSVNGVIHPAVIAREIDNFLHKGDLERDQVTCVSGGFGIGKWTRRVLKAYRPGQVCNGAYQYGSIGPDVGYCFGVSVAVQQGAGVQKGYEGNPVLAVTGDAGFAYSGMEVETMAKYRIPGIVVVYNNNAWGTWTGGARSPRIGHAHLFQENLRYDKIAEALGGHGEYVTSQEEMRTALKRAWDVAKNEKKPVVINCQAKKEFWLTRDYPPGMTGTIEPGIESYAH